MVFNATFNYSSALLVVDTRVHRENHQPAASYLQTLSNNVLSSTPRHEPESKSQRLW